jgi:hypothetical protein
VWYSCPSRFRRISVLLIVATALAMGVVLKLVAYNCTGCPPGAAIGREKNGRLILQEH